MEQTHQDKFVHIKSRLPQSALGVDALVSTEPETSLVIRHADCLPIEIRTPTCVAALHAGRKSTQLKLLQKVVQYIKSFSSESDKYSITFGPHICVNCYQIDRARDTHYSLRDENYKQLTVELPKSAFSLTEVNECTKCNHEKYYSYRGDGKGTPMNYSIILGLQKIEL